MCEASPANQMSNMRPIEQLLRSSQQNAKAFASNCLTLPSLACSAPTPSGETDASSRQAVRRSGHIDLGSERCVHNPAGAIKLIASKARFLAYPASARIQLSRRFWRKIFPCHYSLRFNRHE